MSYKDPQNMVYYALILIGFGVGIAYADPLSDKNAENIHDEGYRLFLITNEGNYLQYVYRYNNYCIVQFFFSEFGDFIDYEIGCLKINDKSFTNYELIKDDLKYRYYNYIDYIKTQNPKIHKDVLEW